MVLPKLMSQILGQQDLLFTSLLAAALLLLPALIARLRVTKQSFGISLRLSGSPTTLLEARDLPSLPFTWPNGQGTEKFFDGRRAARRWRSQYGPIYGIWSGFKREIVLTKPEHVQEFFKDSHKHIKASDNNAGWLFGELLGSCLGVVSQKEWRDLRKPFEPHFTRPSAIGRTAAFIHEARQFYHAFTKGRRESRTINTTDDLKYCPFFMVSSIFFGILTADHRAQLSALGPLREDLFRETFMGGLNRYSIGRYFPGSAASRLYNFQQGWENFVRQAYERSLRTGDGAIVPLWKAIESGDMTMKKLLHTLDESLFANLDVTAHAVSWNVISIAQHLDIQRQVRAEIASNVDSETKYEEYLCRDDTLLAACVLESSRLHPILPFSNPEAANVDKSIDDYIIPRNTDVIVDSYAINVDNAYWEDALSFNPCRHLGKKDQERRYNMWRFGFGPRQCLGKNVADTILRVMVAELLKPFELRLVQEAGVDGVRLQADSWIGLPDCEVSLVTMENVSVP